MADIKQPARKESTHIAWTFRRRGKRPHQGYWLEIGKGRCDEEGRFHSFLDRLPIGGFSGHVIHVPIEDGPPPPPKAEPQRPGEADRDDEDGGESDDGAED